MTRQNVTDEHIWLGKLGVRLISLMLNVRIGLSKRCTGSSLRGWCAAAAMQAFWG